MRFLRTIEDAVAEWADVSMHSHRFGGKEFRVGRAEIGHLHVNGVLDIPFTRRIRNVLIAEGLAEQHQYVPDSGWTTFRIRNEGDVKHALRLLRLSYVRYLLKTALDPTVLWKAESPRLRLPAAVVDALVLRAVARSI